MRLEPPAEDTRIPQKLEDARAGPVAVDAVILDFWPPEPRENSFLSF